MNADGRRGTLTLTGSQRAQIDEELRLLFSAPVLRQPRILEISDIVIPALVSAPAQRTAAQSACPFRASEAPHRLCPRKSA
jgi:hypothetical protein